MKYTYEQYETFYYLHKLLPHLQNCGDFEDNLIRFNSICAAEPLVSLRASKKENKNEREKISQKMIRFLEKQAPCYLEQPLSIPRRNVRELSKLFGLSSAEENLVAFFTIARRNRLLNKILQCFQHDYCENWDILELVAEKTGNNIGLLLKSTAPLMKLGILQRRGYSSDHYASPWLEEYVNNQHKDSAEICSAILGKPIDCDTELSPKNFSYVETANLALRLMKQAKCTKGFNILLYGVPATF